MMLTTFQQIIDEAKKRGGRKIAIAGADSKTILKAVDDARKIGILDPILFGDEEKIKACSEEINISLDSTKIVHKKQDDEIVAAAVESVHNGETHVLMQGKVSTSVLLKAVLNKSSNLRTENLLSHIAILEIPYYPKLLMMTDGGMVIRPTIDQKVSILKNGIDMMQKLGVKCPKVAVLAAIEKVNPDMPETGHAAQLSEMAKDGTFGNAIVEGPMAADIAFSREAARIKGVESLVSGEPDILLVPDIACGNIFAKGIWHLAKAKIAGLILGARKPIILLSRSDDAETKLNSIALGVLTA